MAQKPLAQDSVIRIRAEDPSDAICNRQAFIKLAKVLSYPDDYWYKTQFGKVKKQRRTDIFVPSDSPKGYYYLPTGVIPKIIEYCEKNDLSYKIHNTGFTVPSTDPECPKIEFRKSQEKAIAIATKNGRGIIQAPTAFGKTILAFGIFQAYLQANPGQKVLFLAHTIDLVKQAAEEFKKLGGKVGIIQGRTMEDGDIICATIQTLEKRGIEYYMNKFICLIVDELHHVASFNGRYFKVIQNSFCPARFGLTATLPNTEEGMLAAISCIGPVIHEYSISDGVKAGILSKPKIIFVPYKGSNFMGEMKSYKDIYKKNIVENASRNKAIGRMSKSFSEKGQSSLIFVRQLDHGDKISDILNDLGVEHYWVHGASAKEERFAVKEALEKKHIKVAICSTIWNEGISIKSLNNCILAGGGKDEKMVLQVVGRGTRVDKDKKTVNIWDFLDPQKHLAQHCIERMIVYREQGWEVSILKKKLKEK